MYCLRFFDYLRLSFAQEKSLDILKEIARENEIWTYKKKLDVSDVDNVRARLLPRVQLEQRFELLEGKDVNAAGRHPEADMKESLAIIIKRAWNSYIEERDASKYVWHIISFAAPILNKFKVHRPMILPRTPPMTGPILCLGRTPYEVDMCWQDWT